MTALRAVADEPAEGMARLLDGAVHYVDGLPGAASDLTREDFAAHCAQWRTRTRLRGAALIDALDVVALDGRGGGHFPSASKWRAVARAVARAGGPGAPAANTAPANGDPGGVARGSVVIANGAEGEPLSRKDSALLELRPHLVLDGLAAAADALAAHDAVVWLHEGNHAARASIVRALAERRAAGVDEAAMRVVTGPDRYLSGESSAVVQALSGGPALPQFRRVPTARSGVDGLPTLVQNVETLARVAVVAAQGVVSEHGALLTVSTSGGLTVVEAAPEQTLGEIVHAVAGRRPYQAVLLGGYGGQWARWDEICDVPADEDELRLRGLSLGAGLLAPVGLNQCALIGVADIAEYLAESSARQCGPCLFGLGAVADNVRDLAERRTRRRDPARLRRFLAEIDGRGGCHHPDGAVRMVASAMRVFADDVHAHLHGRCVHEPRRRRSLFGRGEGYGERHGRDEGHGHG